MEGGISGRMSELYDVFVDWEGRLGRELPGLTAALHAADARRVLDVGCGTGRHVGALLDAGLDAWGADVSAEMLDQARAWTGRPERFLGWRLGDPPSAELAAHAPFDAVIALGNVWPQVVSDRDVAAACRGILGLLRPGGLLLLGLKAVAVRRETGNPYLPLLRRERDGQAYFFVRFVEFVDDATCRLHMVVAAGDEAFHRQTPMRVWSPAALRETFAAHGFADVAVSARLDDAAAEAVTEDVFVHARRPPER